MIFRFKKFNHDPKIEYFANHWNSALDITKSPTKLVSGVHDLPKEAVITVALIYWLSHHVLCPRGDIYFENITE